MWTGRTIDGTYRIERELGSGAFGLVYEALDVALDKRVAVKVLKGEQCGPREIDAFITEARNLATLDHPNIVRIHRLGQHEGQHFIVMELLQGATLAEIVRSGRLGVRERLQAMQQVARGLGAMHALGILHRDLSPRNIMLCGNGVTKLFDLGLSRDTSRGRTESMHVIRGTLPYLAPELFHGESATPRSEVYSFGAILYEVLCGEAPLVAEHFTALMYKITNREPEPIEQRVTDCPPALASLVRSCLAKEPSQRPGSLAEVEGVLERVLQAASPDSRVPAGPALRGMRNSTASNPYLQRVMIKRREGFFGRRTELQRIFSRLNASPPGSVSVVGDRKIGKSSLLNHVYTASVRDESLAEPERMVMVYLDLQVEKDMDIATFVDMMLGLVELELHGRLNVSDCERNLNGIQDMVRRLGSAGIRLAILLDEFEVVTRNPHFDLQFFAFLRSLANHHDVAYVTSSARQLQELCHTREISDSPFFNIFSSLRLSAFQPGEAEELVRVPSERIGRPLAPWTAPILALSGLFPCYIQMACAHTLEHLQEHGGREPDMADVRRRFVEEATPHFQYLWDGLTEHERTTLARVANRRSVPDSLTDVADALQGRRYVLPGSPPQLFSEPFAEFVRATSRRNGGASWLGRLFGGR